jgi:hypothetical protein
LTEWLGMIKDVGFPIVVTLYLLYRIEHKLDELNNSIRELPGRLYPNENTRNPHAG